MESIFDGTWASGPWPEEILIADMLLETGWTWQAWNTTPPYLQRVMVDFVQAKRAAENEEHGRLRREQEATGRGH